MRMRRADHAQRQHRGRRAFRPRVGAEAFAASDLRRRIEPGHASADGPAGAAAARRGATARRCREHGLDDLEVAGAAAEDAADRVEHGRASGAGSRATAPRRPSACRACRCRTARHRERRRPAGGDSAPSAPARPSMVVTWRPSQVRRGTMQAQACSSSSSTVQAPQSPAWQPTLVPVRPSRRAARRTSRRDGSADQLGAAG